MREEWDNLSNDLKENFTMTSATYKICSIKTRLMSFIKPWLNCKII